MFKLDTIKAIMKIVLDEYKKEMTKNKIHVEIIVENTEKQKWSMFKKYPDVEVLPLTKRSDTIKFNKAITTNDILNYQTLQTFFREQLGTIVDKKVKTSGSLAE